MGRYEYDSTTNNPSNRKIIIYVCLTLLLLGLLSYFFFEKILEDDEIEKEKEQLARPLIIPDKASSGAIENPGDDFIPSSERPNPDDMPLQMPDGIVEDPRDKPYLDGMDETDQGEDLSQNEALRNSASFKNQYANVKSRDEAIRKEVKELSPKLLQWMMKSDNLITKFMVVINDFSQGIRSFEHLAFLGRNKPFTTFKDSKGYYLDPKSYQRFDPLVEAFSALNVRETMLVYKQFKPLLQDAYEKFGYPKGYKLEDVFNKAIAKVLDTPIILDRIPLVRRTTIYYKYADASLESLDPVQKQFIRMGPENTKKVQIKLRQFASAIADMAE